jgi:ankyrin repeat protein
MDTDSSVDFIKFIRFFGCADINQVDKQGRTLLHTAAQRGDVHKVKLLLQNNASTLVEDKYRFGAYGLALREDQYECAWAILTEAESGQKGAGTFGSLLHLAVTKL